MKTTILLAILLSLAAACSKDDKPKVDGPAPGTASPGTGQPGTREPGDGHAHEMENDLGAATAGALTFRVVQRAKIAPGAESDFDLVFAAGTRLPEAVRVWIGDEAATGSRKVRMAKETETVMHGHPEAPAPIPADARLWIDVEGQGRTSLPLPR